MNRISYLIRSYDQNQNPFIPQTGTFVIQCQAIPEISLQKLIPSTLMTSDIVSYSLVKWLCHVNSATLYF